MPRSDYIESIAELQKARQQSLAMGGELGIERQHSRGKLTARERIALLLDENSFDEYGALANEDIRVPGRPVRPTPAAGVITGVGRIAGRPVLVVADDATIAGGARGLAGLAKVQRFRLMANRRQIPIVFLLEASAGRVDDQMGARFANFVADPHQTLFGDLVEDSGQVPIVTAIVGSAVGAAAFTAALSDFTTIVAGQGHIAVAGPPVVAGAIGKKVDFEELGGHQVHAELTGTVDHVAQSEPEAFSAIRRFLSYLPSNSSAPPSKTPSGDDPRRMCPELYDLVPVNRRRAYDVRPVLACIFDIGTVFELQPSFGPSLVTAFARLDGRVVGLIANQPKVNGGVLDARAARKMEHFLSLCDAFHVPIITFIDTPGFMVGPESERESLVVGAARLLQIHHAISVPRIAIVLRKAYGLAYSIMGGTPMSPDTIASWPAASFSLMDPAPAANVLFAKDIANAEDSAARRRELLEMVDAESSPFIAARNFGIDDVIDPAETRAFLSTRLETIGTEPKFTGFKHRVVRC